jgi:hypothetical protein
MKTRFHIILISIAICAVLLSCKKKKKYYTTQVFWFDKATKDSLVKHGYTLFSFVLTDPNQSGDTSPKVCDTTYFSFPHDCNDQPAMNFKRLLAKGEKQTIGYKIMYMEKAGTANVYTGTQLRNWEGNFQLIQGACNNTQLVW